MNVWEAYIRMELSTPPAAVGTSTWLSLINIMLTVGCFLPVAMSGSGVGSSVCVVWRQDMYAGCSMQALTNAGGVDTAAWGEASQFCSTCSHNCRFKTSLQIRPLSPQPPDYMSTMKEVRL